MIEYNKIIGNAKLSELELNVLEYMINNIDNILELGVRGIASNTYTSTSTIMRLAKKLGFKGFLDMYYYLKPAVKSSSEDIQNSFVDKIADSKDIFKFNNYDDIKLFSRHLNTCRDGFIFIYATGFSAIFAEYITKKLLVLGKKTLISTGADSMGIFENNLNCIDMFICLSRSGETSTVIDRIKMAKENDIFTIAFTNETNNTVSKLTDISFKIEDDHKLDFRNMQPNSFFAKELMLIEILFYEYSRIVELR